MEYIDAPTIASYRGTDTERRCTLTSRAQVLADMTQALFYIHSRGVVHNDIKPSNILFSPVRGAVLIDFGLSTELGDTAVHMGGSPWYIPYEYVEDGRRGAPGDVFALGVVMLFVLGGISLPESNAGKLNWRISDVRKMTGTDVAKNTMLRWLQIVEGSSKDLLRNLDRVPLGVLVNKMLENLSLRISVEELMQRQSLDQ